MSNVTNSITRGLGKAKLSIMKNSDKITLVSSIIFGGIALGTAIHSTLQAEDVIDHHNERLDKIHKALEIADPGEYTEQDAKQDTFKAYVKTGWEFTKLYAPTVIFAGLSVASALTSHKILSNRNLALAASFAALKKEWEEYRGRVVRDLGSEMDRHFLYDTVDKTIEHTEKDAKGKEKVVTETIKAPTKYSVYSRIFDESNRMYTKDGAANYIKLRGQLLDFNRKIIRDGYAFLNKGYLAFGFPITIAGQQAGWVYDPHNPESSLCQIKGFGTVKVSRNGDVYLEEDYTDSYINAFRNGYERSCLLEFKNIRDSIYDDIQAINSDIAAI